MALSPHVPLPRDVRPMNSISRRMEFLTENHGALGSYVMGRRSKKVVLLSTNAPKFFLHEDTPNLAWLHLLELHMKGGFSPLSFSLLKPFFVFVLHTVLRTLELLSFMNNCHRIPQEHQRYTRCHLRWVHQYFSQLDQ